VGGELLALYHKPQAVADGTSSTSTICIDLRATDLDDALSYIKAACTSIAQKVAADGEAPPRKEPDDGDGGWVPPKEVGLFKGAPLSDTVSGHHFQGKLELIEELALQEQLEQQPAAEKAKEAEAFTCRGCTGKYTDGSGSGSGTKYNYGFCSSECREAAKKAPRAPPTQCEHGRQKSRCKDCDTGYYCEHRRRKGVCKDCGTGHCQHGRQKPVKFFFLRLANCEITLIDQLFGPQASS
jgi:hypothetical protein